MKTINFLAALFLVFIFGCITKDKTTLESGSDKTDISQSKKIASMESEKRLNKFAFNLYNKIIDDENHNLVISPFSISTAMAMAYGGADGETKNQMSESLFFDPDMDIFHKEFSDHVSMIENLAGEDLKFNIANGMWVQYDYPLLNSYIETIKENYGSVLHEADFKDALEKEREEINKWVEEKTEQKIKELIQEGVLCDDTQMVIVNAIYFLSKWLHEFEEELTKKREFYPEASHAVEAEFMEEEAYYKYYEDEYAQVIEIPYSGENFSMLLMLPRENMGLSDFESRLDSEIYDNYIGSLERSKVNLYLPKFKMRFHANLEDIMKRMGMPLAFSDRADFTGMTAEDDLKIDRVIHQSFIEVDEKGTEAAASTAVTMIRKTAMPDDEKITFRADRPFNFFIKDNVSNTILFMGRVINPAE